MDRKLEILDKKEKEIIIKEKEITSRERLSKEKDERLTLILNEEKIKLERISGLTVENAKKMLFANLEDEARHDASFMMKKIEDEARETAREKAKRIITIAIERTAMEHTVETTVSVVSLPNEEMKGRIIGREGRNIRAFEAATGIDLIVDDTPEAVVLSGFDVIRREIARKSLERLIMDGRIHPSRIEEVVAKVKTEMDIIIKEIGEKAVIEAGVSGIHPEIIKLLGKLKYRTSYGQNVLQHSLEVCYLAGNLASELGFDVSVAKRAGLLHDIGKSIDKEVEGTHPEIGVEIAKRFNESQNIIEAIRDHHGDDQQRNIYAVLIQAADSISGSRPGARGDTKENYIKRLEKLEKVAASFTGVQKSYAIQAGREIRIMVEHTQMGDAEASQLAKDISKKIEQSLEYPGEIKVTVIREARFTEYAK